MFDFILFLFRNKSVYILTSVLEPPFLMEKQKGGQPQQQTQSYGNDRFEGKDTKQRSSNASGLITKTK